MLSTEPLLQAQEISLRDRQRTLLQDIDLTVSANEIVTIIGPNGAGKSSLLNILLGLRKPTRGKVIRSPELTIGYMPQRLQLNPQMPLTVERFLSLTHHGTLHIEQALEKTGVQGLKKTSMHHLSGGETQRVLLSRALLRQPQLLVLDEPAQGVDITGQSQLYDLIAQLRSELKCGVLMVSHDLHIVMAATDRVICLNQHICCHGHPDKISNHPAYLEMFGHATGTNVAIYTHHHDHSHDVHGDVLDVNDKEGGYLHKKHQDQHHD
ncbi:zinc ABC transporter ATP-binding protein ZnuC [Candidatus Endobugula sertula]|uniref:Zinc ABC transporter ATP-binding protein ZnuC n=1 Tax=Candidatus Endobugula sertula TaxID=62101 RepID=A0A1D2QR56_9GAMM|nr:zinc ABC transporter ATP-binding protein ZnuC [Candidatus Endobugula sertula]